jgi:hypothetical protein
VATRRSARAELESLAVGIAGKEALWRALQRVGTVETVISKGWSSELAGSAPTPRSTASPPSTRPSLTAKLPAAILDVDGTLVDSNYHHALAWYRAFREHEVVLPIWRVHRHVGMARRQVRRAVAGEDVERRLGDTLRERWERHFDELLPEVEAFDGAYDVIAALRSRGHRIVLASSAIQSHFDAFVDDKLGARELADDWRQRRRRRDSRSPTPTSSRPRWRRRAPNARS